MTSDDDSNNNHDNNQTDILTLPKIKTRTPRMYKVLMHNDDYSTMEFVIHVLKRFFNKNDADAHSLMLKVHTEGKAMCGLYTFEVAESKTVKVNRYAREKGHPLKCSNEADA